MGLAEGGISYRTYYVDGDLPDDYRELFLARVNLNKFEPLVPEAEEDMRYGWVPIDDILGDSFQSTTLFLNQYVALALRIDKWAIPPLLLKAAVRKGEEGMKQETKREHISRSERGELVDRERGRLKRNSLPAVRAIDVCWNVDTGVLRISSTSRNVNEIFTDLFERTFTMRLVPDSPYISALHCGLDDELIGQLADVEPARLLGGNDGPA